MKNFNLENILIFFWLCILFSINSVYINTIPLYDIKSIPALTIDKNIFVLFNTFRFYLPILLLPILLVIFFSHSVKKINVMLLLFFLYYLWQFFIFFISGASTGEYPLLKMWSSHLITRYEESLGDNIYLTSSSICILIIISIAKNLNLNKFIKKILLVSILFIGIASIYLGYNLLSESIHNNLKFIYNSQFLNSFDWKTLEQASPRITGVSRMIMILYFITFFYFLNCNKKILFYLILVILGMLIYKMQARGSLLGVLLLFLFFLIFSSFSLRKKIMIIFFILIIPIFLFETYYYFKTNKDYIFNANLYNSTSPKDNANLYNSTSPKERSSNLNRVLDLKNTASSGRKQLWKNSLLLIKEKKIILGYGPKADRFLLTEFYARYENTKYYIDSYGNNFLVESNVSNALIYAYLSGGFLGFLLLLTINIIASLTILKNIFIEKIFLGKDTIKLFSTTLLIFLGVRSVFENSYSVFGIDYIFFILSYMLAQKK
jgi:hypothetical protein